jgi:transposase InsO family protein
MPFLETGRMEQRVMMLLDYDTGAFNVSQLCARYGVSRDVFYYWRARRLSGAADWFVERSHATVRCPHRTAGEVAAQAIAVRRRFPHFGPKKIRAWLGREQPGTAWPAASTIGDILKAQGLVSAVPRRRRAVEQGLVVSPARAANDEWCADFKGWFLTGDGSRCDPLTLSDSFSRYNLGIRISEQTIDGVWPVFTAAFREHGLPGSIRVDNGTPFGTRGPAGLSRLSVWWLRLGVQPRFIPPASPQDNGRHERFHKTLKAQTTKPPGHTLAEQQISFDSFRRHFNHERPHEALDQAPPARLWTPSSRPFPERLDEPDYAADHQLRRVRPAGDIKWKGANLFIGEAFAGQLLGVAEHDDGLHIVRFCGVDLGVINRRSAFLRFAPLRHRLREPQEGRAKQKLSTISPVQTVDHQTG